MTYLLANHRRLFFHKSKKSYSLRALIRVFQCRSTSSGVVRDYRFTMHQGWREDSRYKSVTSDRYVICVYTYTRTRPGK